MSKVGIVYAKEVPIHDKENEPPRRLQRDQSVRL